MNVPDVEVPRRIHNFLDHAMRHLERDLADTALLAFGR
jgi:hypothetical protein